MKYSEHQKGQRLQPRKVVRQGDRDGGELMVARVLLAVVMAYIGREDVVVSGLVAADDRGGDDGGGDGSWFIFFGFIVNDDRRWRTFLNFQRIIGLFTPNEYITDMLGELEEEVVDPAGGISAETAAYLGKV
ncbi:hypothetical protein Tco_1367341 [Tanacetum coccineum]